jgi:tetratricopeptide (TPR) repeat protein
MKKMKKNILYGILVLSLLSGCANNQKEMNAEIFKMEHGSELSTPEGMLKYCEKLEEFVNRFPEDEQSAVYLHKAAVNYYLIKKFDKALQLSHKYLSTYPNGLEKNPTLTNIAHIYNEGLTNSDSAIKYYNLANEVKPLSVLDKNDLGLNYQKLAQANENKDIKKSIEYYNQSAQYMHTTGAFAGSIANLLRIVELEPNSPKAPNILQQVAFTYENDVLDTENAIKYYSLLVKNPITVVAKQAEYLLNNNLVGKPAEEVLEFSLKNKAK